MGVVEAFLHLCASAAAMFAIALAYDTRKELDDLKKSIGNLAEEDDEIVGGRDVRGDRDQGE